MPARPCWPPAPASSATSTRKATPGRRYYGGCEHVDVVETLAIERAKELFGAEHANVQPHSGAQANMAVYFALLEPGDTVMGMQLDHGGHLTHGAKVNFSGKLYNFVSYGVDRETETIDFDEVERLAQRNTGPRSSSPDTAPIPRVIDFPRFRAIADSVGGVPDGGHGPHLRPDCGRGASFAAASRPDRYLHHAEEPAGAARRVHHVHRGTGQRHRLRRFPRDAGRAHDAHYRRQGRSVSDRPSSRNSRAMPTRWWRTARCWPRSFPRRVCGWCRAAPTTT